MFPVWTRSVCAERKERGVPKCLGVASAPVAGRADKLLLCPNAAQWYDRCLTFTRLWFADALFPTSSLFRIILTKTTTMLRYVTFSIVAWFVITHADGGKCFQFIVESNWMCTCYVLLAIRCGSQSNLHKNLHKRPIRKVSSVKSLHFPFSINICYKTLEMFYASIRAHTFCCNLILFATFTSTFSKLCSINVYSGM
jgi:hypothetical protein